MVSGVYSPLLNRLTLSVHGYRPLNVPLSRDSKLEVCLLLKKTNKRDVIHLFVTNTPTLRYSSPRPRQNEWGVRHRWCRKRHVSSTSHLRKVTYLILVRCLKTSSPLNSFSDRNRYLSSSPSYSLPTSTSPPTKSSPITKNHKVFSIIRVTDSC